MEIVAADHQSKNGEVRYLIIVAYDQPNLYEHLKQAFSGDKKVEVILERRRGDQRRSERRHGSDVDDQLRSLGWALTRRHDRPPPADLPRASQQ